MCDFKVTGYVTPVNFAAHQCENAIGSETSGAKPDQKQRKHYFESLEDQIVSLC